MSGNGVIGRPTDCTPELTAALCATIEEIGNFDASASQNDITVRTLHSWRSRGRREEGTVYALFLHATDSARARWKAGILKSMAAAADVQTVQELDKFGEVHDLKKPGDWRARAWAAERVSPEDFCTNSKVFGAKHLLMFLDSQGFEPTEEAAIALIGQLFDVDATKAANITAKALDSKDKQAAVDLLKRFKQGGTNGREVRE